MTEAPTTTDAEPRAGRGELSEHQASPATLTGGAPVGAPGTGALGLSSRHAAALAWVGGWFSGSIVWWLDPADRFVRVHAVQSVVAIGGLMALAIGSWGLGLLMAFVTPFLFRALTWLSTATWVVLVAVWLAGLVQAWRGRTLRLPVVSGWVDRLTSRHSTLQAPLHPL